MVYFLRRFSKFGISNSDTGELVACLSLLKRPKLPVSVNKKYAFPGYLKAPRSFYFRYFRQQFSIITQTYCLTDCSLSEAHNQLRWL